MVGPSRRRRPPLAVDRQALGAAAEDAACTHLRAHGLQLLARNVRFRFGELDLVMREGGTIVFVEVRRRGRSDFGGAAASVDARKMRKLALAAQAWLAGQRALRQAPCRFDVVAVSPGNEGLHCDWLRAAFTLDDLA